jgi:hypothetical protein
LDSPSFASYKRDFPQLRGWFSAVDADLFGICASVQKELGLSGDLLEIGTYAGKSAIMLGFMRQANEKLWICDPFETNTPDPSNAAENLKWYSDLTLEEFKGNFLQYHDQIPEICQLTSRRLGGMLTPKTFRFIHIDGSHEFGAVNADLHLSRSLLLSGGLVVVDDFRGDHSQDVAAATWKFILSCDLLPFALSRDKLYAVWVETSRSVLQGFQAAIGSSDAFRVTKEALLGNPLLVVHPNRYRPKHSALLALTPPLLASLLVKLRDWLRGDEMSMP